MSDLLFYMQDSRGLCGSNVMFWGAKGGYTTNLDQLQIYTLEEAQKQHNSRATDVPLLKSLVDESSIVGIDSQVLPESFHDDPNDEAQTGAPNYWQNSRQLPIMW